MVYTRIIRWFLYLILLALLFRALGGIVRIVMYLVPPRQKCATRIKRGRPPEEEAWEVAAKTEARGPLPSLHVAVLVTGTRGDVDPFCATAIEIARSGHRVRLAAHACYRGVIADRAREAGVALEFYPLAGDPIAADILNNWDVVRGEWVPLLPFAMKIGRELYHPAHGGDERPRSGSYTRAVNGCFDPTAGGEKKE